MPTPSGDTDGAEDNRSKSNDLGDQDEAPTTVRVPVRLDLFSTGLELIEVPIVAGGAMTVAAVNSDRLRELQRPLACRSDCGNDGVPEIGLVDRAPVPCRVPQRRPDELVAV